MQYTSYKKIHEKHTKTTRLTVVEWHDGSVTIDKMDTVSKDACCGSSVYFDKKTAKTLQTILKSIYYPGII